jgi:DNA-binding beta-propeller fold protein YncE
MICCGGSGPQEVAPVEPSSASCQASTPDTARAELVATTPISGWAQGIVVDAPRHRAIVGIDTADGWDDANGFATVDLETGKETLFARTPVSIPVDIAFDPGANEVFVAVDDRVYVLDADAGTLLSTILLPGNCSNASAIAFDAGAHRLFVLGRHDEWGDLTHALAEIDTQARAVTRTVDTDLTFSWEGGLLPELVFDADAGRLRALALATLSQAPVVVSYDTDTLAPVSEAAFASKPLVLTVDGAGAPVVVTNGPATLAEAGAAPEALPDGFVVDQVAPAGAGRLWVLGRDAGQQPEALLYVRCGGAWKLRSTRILPPQPGHVSTAAVTFEGVTESLLLGFAGSALVLQEVRVGTE